MANDLEVQEPPVKQSTTEDGLPIFNVKLTHTEDGLPVFKKKKSDDESPSTTSSSANGSGNSQGFQKVTPNSIKQAKTPLPTFETTGVARKKNAWENLGDFVPQTVLGGLDKDAGQAIRFIGDNFGMSAPGKNPISRLGQKLEGWGDEHIQKAQEHQLPNTTGGSVATSVTNLAPMLMELALTPELDVAKVGKLGEVLTKYGGKYAPKIANAAAGKFPTLMGAKGLTSGYTEAIDKGATRDEALKAGLINSAEEAGKGVLYEGAGAAAGKVTDIGSKALEDAGLMSKGKIVSGAQKAILNSTAQGAAFSAVPFVTNALQGKSTSMDEFKNNFIFGGVLGAFHGDGKNDPEKPTAADGAAKEMLERSPVIDLHNFMTADMDAIKYAHNLDTKPLDLQMQSAAHAEKAFNEENPEEKQNQIVQSSLNGKLASVKSVTQAILKDKQAVIDAVPDVTGKEQIVEKINQVHKELDPTEQKKTAIGQQIANIDEQIKVASEKVEDPVMQAENEVKLESLTKQREELNNSLKDLIVKQNEQTTPNKEIPAEQPADETVGVPKVADQNDETIKDNPIEDTYPYPKKPLDEMSSDEIREHAKEIKQHYKDLEVKFFGEDGAKEYRQAQAVSDSQFTSSEKRKEAYKIVDKYHDSLSPEQSKMFFGEGKDYNDPSDLRDLAQRVHFIEESENVDDLASSIKNPLLDFSSDRNQQDTNVLLKAAGKKAVELGISPQEMLKKAFEKIGNDLPGKSGEDLDGDKELLIKSILKKLTEKSEVHTETNSPKLEEPKKQLTKNSPINPVENEKGTKEQEETSTSEEKGSSAESKNGDEKAVGAKESDVKPTGGAETSPVTKIKEDATKEIEQQEGGEPKYKEGDKSGKETQTGGGNSTVGTAEGKATEAVKPRFKIKGDKITPLPLREHAELNALLKEDGITIQHLKDEHAQRNIGGDSTPETSTNEKNVQQPENDSPANDGEHRQGEAPKSSKSTFKKPEKEVEKTILTQRAYKGEVSDEVKKYLEDKGLTRASYSQDERSKQATDFIDKFGDDAAYHALKSGDIDGGMAASVLAQLQIRNSRAVEDLPEDNEERVELEKKHADLIDLMEKKGYFSGEFIGQLAHEYQNNELNFASIKRQVEKITGKKLTKEQEAKIKEVTQENERLKKNLQDAESKLIEETDMAFKAGQEDVKNETKADKAKRIANKLRTAKIHRPGIFSSATPASIAWDGAVEVVAKSIEVGGKLADAIDKGLEHIRATEWYKELSENRKSQAEKEFTNFNHDNVSSTDINDLQQRFADKSDNKFTTSEARDLWGYMKETYLNNGVSFRDAMSKTAEDLGLSWRQVSEAITTPKTKRASDEMWKRQSELLRNRASIKNWINDHESSEPIKLLKKVSGMFRGVAVFAHGHIFIGTHAGMTLFQPSTWNKTIPAFFRGFKLAYGNTADYERAMEELKNSPNYLIAQRAGLKNDPERINTEEFQKSQQYLGKLGKVGERGFNTIKVLRQALFDNEFNKLSAAERDDPEVAKNIAKLMNLATGATNLNLPSWVNEATFAGGMETARWGKLTSSPAKATKTALNALFSPEKATVSDRVFAKVWARRVGEQLATYLVARTVNAAINNLLNPTNKEKTFNPTNLDWWKFKFGNTTIDPTSGMRSAAGFIYTIGKVMFENQKELHGDKRDKVLGKEIEGYSRGKLAPLYSTLTDFYANRDFKGNVMPKFPIKSMNRYETPGKGKHKLSWQEYGSSKLPLPMAEAFGIFYQSALDNGVPKSKLDAAVKGIIGGAISGTTGFRVGKNKKQKGSMKKIIQ